MLGRTLNNKKLSSAIKYILGYFPYNDKYHW